MDRREMMQLYLGTTDAQAEVSGQPVQQGGPGDWCLHPAFLHCSLAAFTQGRWNRERLYSVPGSPCPVLPGWVGYKKAQPLVLLWIPEMS